MSEPATASPLVTTNDVVRDGVPTLFCGLAAGFAIFAVINGLRLSGPEVAPVVTFNSFLAVAFGGLWLIRMRRDVSTKWANPIAAGALLLAVSNVLTTFWLVHEPLQNQIVAVLLISAGFFLLSHRWLALFLIVTLLAWLPIAWAVRSSAGGFAQLGSTFCLGVVVAVAIHSARLRTHRRLQQAQTALHATWKQYQQLFAQSKDTVIITTPAGSVIDLNQAGLDLFGLRSKEEARKIDMGRDVYVDPAERERLVSILLETGYARDYPSTIKTPLGQIEIEGTASTIKDADGKVIRFLGVVRDVTRRRKAELELAHQREELETIVRERTHSLEVAIEQLQQEIDQRQRVEIDRRRIEARMQQAQKLESLGLLASGIAHDFNNLLVAVLGSAGLARMEISDDSPAHPHLLRIGKAANRAGELASQMLDYSGRGQLELKTTNLGNLVEEMSELLGASISKKTKLELEIASDLPSIQADPTQLRQVTMNLITNASDALEGRTGAIRVRVRAGKAEGLNDDEIIFGEHSTGGAYVFLEVSDTGCGMDAATASRIFDPFFSTKVTGRGLGMAAVLGIVRGHGAWIQLHSVSGEGSRFLIAFPVTGQLHSEPDESRTAVAAADWTASGTAVVIDDEPLVRSVVSGYLEKLGFEVLVAVDGRQGVEIFRSKADEIILVVLDKNMPGLDGGQTCKALRRIRPDIKVILSSGDGKPFSGGHLADVVKRSSAILKKPYQIEDLRQVVFELLG